MTDEAVTFKGYFPPIVLTGNCVYNWCIKTDGRIDMPYNKKDWGSVDKSDWGKYPDSEIGKRFGVTEQVIRYWRKKFCIPSYDDYLSTEREKKFSEGFLWCGACKQYLPIDDFGKNKQGRFGYRSECSSCRRNYRIENSEKIKNQKHRHYENNREAVLQKCFEWRTKNKERTNAYMHKRTNGFKSKFVRLAGGACQRCGYSEFDSALAFHHVDPEFKEENPVKAINSGDYERAYSEVDKCVLVCFNCHQGYHSGDWVAEFEKRDGLGWTVKKTV